MSRTRSVALALVNWKGVFYERYLLDRNVTALEGANGAGKTTVMIAAYVVLLPDMSRLRFTNLGESGAVGGDRGIWGRLGEPGRPSYSVLDLEVAGGERLVAGIRLTRKGEPTVEPTPFLVTGLGSAAKLQELLLVSRGDEDHVPELDELRANAKRLGGELVVFRTLKEYFAALFDRGVTPLRLASDEDKNKLNEMLRTSMTGGISRALTSELRSFLLKEETGLADTLTRMRGNLEACRRTRTEVGEARHLERDISSVYDAGLGYFLAGALAVKRGADEARARLTSRRAASDAAERRRAELARTVAGHAERSASATQRLAELRRELEAAGAARDRRRRAAVLAAELATLEGELAGLGDVAAAARRARDVAESERSAEKQGRDAAQDAYDRAAAGLARLQDGLDEMHRRAHAHRRARRLLDEAREALGDPSLDPDRAGAALGELGERCDSLDAEHARLDRERSFHAARRDEHARAMAALDAVEEALGIGDASAPVHARARAALAKVASLESLAGRRAEVEREAAEARRLADKQARVVARAAELGIAAEPGAADALAARLAAAEAERDDADDRARREDAAAADARRRHENLLARREILEDRAARFATCAAAAERLAAALGPDIAHGTTADADRVLAARHAELLAQRSAWSAERELLLQRAAALEAAGGAVPSWLLELRDDLGGELVAGRFEELALYDAARVEARLGPLAHAIVVDDPAEAARRIAATDLDGASVWLVGAGTPLEAAATERGDDAAADVVVVDENGALRVSPLPAAPSLGRRARERSAEALRASAARLDAELDAALERLHAIAEHRRDAALLAEEREVFSAGAPDAELAAIAADAEAALEAAARHGEAATAARDRMSAARAEVTSLRALLPDAMLLDPPDHAARAETLAAERDRAVGVADELAAIADAHRCLAELVDVLRAPPDDRDPDDIAERQRELSAERDRLFRGREALAEVLANRHALAWSDAEATLQESSALVPALEAQHADARACAHDAAARVATAEARWEQAVADAQAADAEHGAALAARDRLAAELEAISGDDEGDADVDAAARRVAALEAEVVSLAEEGARDRERLAQAESEAASTASALAAATTEAGPAAEAWASLRDACEEHDLLHPVVTARESRAAEPASALALAVEAKSKRELLLDRVARSRGGDELAAEIAGDATTLEVWLAVRAWLRRRVPAQVAEVADPLLALERLRDQLGILEERLGRQEGDLRGSSADIARGIDVQLRRAAWQVRRISQHLTGVSFGSIRGIRVELRRVERMEQILRALGEADTQALLFQSALPIEDALDEVFRRYGGGRTGGQRLLDYREYLELAVEVQRRGKDDWEQASPTRLSTGEAIGVGAALMMVVLTEWERDANLLRARPGGGSLRFLFLDEANRLSRDNLGVLFDLCRNLELQLLIAAPEVAQAEGNTTYRLVRRVSDDGREEVLVSGRRAVASTVEASSQ